MTHATRTTIWQASCVVLLLTALLGSLSTQPLLGQQAPDTEAGKPAPAADQPAPPRGRLPAYYGQVVSSKQRTEIYAIQADFNGRIEKLQEQIEMLEGERDMAVEQVLTPDQRKRVAELQEAARARREARAADNAVDSEPVEPSGTGEN